MNLMELFVKIGVDDQASSKLSGITGKIGGGLKTAAGIGVKAVTAASGAIVGLTTLAIKNYAEYEQLVGGVQTLFGASADRLMGYAEKAFMTAGMSANQYMEIATSFSASLLQSLEGDTAKAADYADMAMQDMADNANKMGTSIDIIQQSYQSFARGNYAMLDNLKLGYGGTKAEMERLIEDASKLDSTVEAGNLSFGNMVKAIHAVQEELGITGTTMREASETITGSLMMTRAAWSNLVTGVADDNADFGRLIDEFVESAGIAANNLLPRIEIALVGVGKLIEELFPVVMDRIPSIITNTLPAILNSAAQIVVALGKGILDNATLLVTTALDLILTLSDGLAAALPEMIPAIVDVVLQIVNTLTDPNTLSSFVDAALAIILALADGLIAATPQLIAAIPSIIANIVVAIVKNLPKIFKTGVQLLKKLWDGIKSWTKPLKKNVKTFAESLPEKIVEGLGSLLSAGLNWIKSLWKGISNWAENLKNNVLSLAQSLPERIKTGIGTLLEIGLAWIVTLWSGILSWAESLKSNVFSLAQSLPGKIKSGLGSLISHGLDWIKSLWTGISNWAGTLKNNVLSLAQSLPGRIKDGLGSLLNIGTNWLKTLWDGINNWASSLKTKVSDLMSAVKKKAGDVSFYSVGKNAGSGIASGLSDSKKLIEQAAVAVVNAAVAAAAVAAQIKSPSRLFRDKIGKFLTLGAAEGMLDEIPAMENATKKVIEAGSIGSFNVGSYVRQMPTAFVGNNNEMYAGGGISVVQNIYSKAQTAADLMQEAIYQQERAVWIGV